MKKIFSILGLLTVVGICNVQSQIVKRIHLDGGAEINIPIDNVNNVRIIEEGGSKFLRVFQESGDNVSIAVSEIDSITHIPSEELVIEPNQLGELTVKNVSGIVRNQSGEPVFGAKIRAGFGTTETITDNNGVFFLNDIIVYEKLGYITISKEGYHQASRSFLPLETVSNQLNVQLLPMSQSGSFSSVSGGTVTSGLLQLNFPANSVEQNGQPYTGTVNVYATALDPSSSEMFDQMPGELLGGMNDSLRLLRSFGMASIELRDTNMNELALAEGILATLTFNIPTDLQADAPETIDWWSFEETLGIWKHEGEAIKQGNQYVGQASHFSWWNCDVPQNFNDFQGSVNTADGTPISNALVNVVTPTMGTGVTYTNAEGEFSGRVPKNQLLTLNIFLTCETTNDWALAYSEEFSSDTQPITGQYQPASLDGRFPITGTVTNCEGQPVQSGYVKIGSVIHLTNNGEFTILACSTGDFVIRGFDSTTPNAIRASEFDTVQVGANGIVTGELQACQEIYGSIADIDGNIYPTVLIGNQFWMAENLKTAHFADGSQISNVTDNTAWSALSTPAWCNFQNNESNDLIYGKLYNWFTVADPQNICPTGWHIPTEAEWTILTDYLGGLSVAGGEMKSVSGWNPPNAYATNESGFSGLPGGFRTYFNGEFGNFGNYGYWWSSTVNDNANAWYCYLATGNGNSYIASYFKQSGYSVRCLRD